LESGDGAAVCGAENHAGVANCDASQRVTGKGDIIEVGRGSAYLVTPSNSGICCVQDCACQANGKSYVCCWKINTLYELIEK